MRKFTIMPATEQHAHHLSMFMRAADKAEVYASSGARPEDALLRGMRCTPYCWAALDDQGVIAMWGIAETDKYSTTGIPWGLCAERACTEYRLPFLREGLRCTREGRKRYNRLENWVYAENTDHIRFIRWCGYHVHPAVPHGFLNEPFHRFEIHGGL